MTELGLQKIDTTINVEEQHANLLAELARIVQTMVDMPYDPHVSLEDRKNRRIVILGVRLEVMKIMSLLTELQVHQIMAQLQLLDQCFRDHTGLNWLRSEDQNED